MQLEFISIHDMHLSSNLLSWHGLTSFTPCLPWWLGSQHLPQRLDIILVFCINHKQYFCVHQLCKFCLVCFHHFQIEFDISVNNMIVDVMGENNHEVNIRVVEFGQIVFMNGCLKSIAKALYDDLVCVKGLFLHLVLHEQLVAVTSTCVGQDIVGAFSWIFWKFKWLIEMLSVEHLVYHDAEKASLSLSKWGVDQGQLLVNFLLDDSHLLVCWFTLILDYCQKGHGYVDHVYSYLCVVHHFSCRWCLWSKILNHSIDTNCSNLNT